MCPATEPAGGGEDVGAVARVMLGELEAGRAVTGCAVPFMNQIAVSPLVQLTVVVVQRQRMSLLPSKL